MNDKRFERTLLPIRVIKHLPMGLLVVLGNGQEGLVRIRELPAKVGKEREWEREYPVGWSGQALLIASPKNKWKELSLRLVEYDPWHEFQANFEPGCIYEGTVTGVVEYGAFINIGLGITGLLHKSALPAWVREAPMEIFWPGDHVRVIADKADFRRRRIGLRLATDINAFSGLSLQTAASGQIDDHEVNPTWLLKHTHRHHILIVDDNAEQRISICTWLRHVGQQVSEVDSAEAALEFLERIGPDMILIDVGLPGLMDGITLADVVMNQYPRIETINMTDWMTASERSDELALLREKGGKFLEKPPLPGDLLAIIKASSKDFPMPDASLTVEEAGLPSPVNIHGKRILDLLRECRLHLDFEICLLFRLDVEHRLVTLAGKSGTTDVNESVIASLLFSPVRDVAEDKKMIVTNDAGDSEKSRFRYLLEFYPAMRSCIGVPIELQSSFCYALFVLGQNIRHVTPEQKTYITGIAFAIRAMLEDQEIRERTSLLQHTALVGQLARNMMHELTNIVGPLSLRLNNLQLSIQSQEKVDSAAAVSELGLINANVKKLIKLAHVFGRITLKGNLEIVRMDQVIQETSELLREPCARAHVHIDFILPEKLSVVRSQGAALQQIILNIILNAIQQIDELRPGTGGQVNIRIDHPDNTNNFFRVLIEDNGPGIHAGLWEKIFQIGFTTRQDGSGIGLYISRNLIEQIGGKLYVQKSFILGGTTFVLEVPAHI